MVEKYRFLIPWLLGALCWLCISLVALQEYQRIRAPDQDHARELWLLLSLLWSQFGFAGIYQAVRGGRGYKIFAFFLVTILPPLLLYFIAFVLTLLA